MAVLVSLFLGALGAFVISRYAYSLGLLDLPNERSSHKSPTPRGGGIGILLGVVAAALLTGMEWGVWVPAAALALVSFLDDKLGLSARARLLIQYICAVAAVYLLPVELPGPGSVALLLMVFWPTCLVATSNFYNFMDGINGMAGLTGVLAFGALAVFAQHSGLDEGEVLFNLGVAAACLGFLPLNFPRARVFMGDVGSILLGFLFASQVFRYSASPVSFFMLCGFLFLYYADTITTLVIRKLDGEKLSQAHRRHLYQILANEFGLPHYAVTLLYGAVQALISASLLFFGPQSNMSVLAILGFWTVCFLAATFHLRKKAALFGRVRVGK